jgi:hypothetical protein
MRACFLGQNVTALGFGVAMLQTPPLPEPEHPQFMPDQSMPDAAPQKASKPPEPAPAAAPEAA